MLEIRISKKCDFNKFKNHDPFDTKNSSDTIVMVYLSTPDPWEKCYELDRRSLKTLKNYITTQKKVNVDSHSLKRYIDWGSYGVIVKYKGILSVNMNQPELFNKRIRDIFFTNYSYFSLN